MLVLRFTREIDLSADYVYSSIIRASAAISVRFATRPEFLNRWISRMSGQR